MISSLLLAEAGPRYNTQSFSLKGSATWPQGFDIPGEVLGSNSGGGGLDFGHELCL